MSRPLAALNEDLVRLQQQEIEAKSARIAELEQLNRRLLDHLRFLGHTTEIDANGNICQM